MTTLTSRKIFKIFTHRPIRNKKVSICVKKGVFKTRRKCTHFLTQIGTFLFQIGLWVNILNILRE